MNSNEKKSFTKIDTEPVLISVEQACKIVGIGRNTMLKLAKIKGFPALILPGKILIDKDEIHNWVKLNYGYFKN